MRKVLIAALVFWFFAAPQAAQEPKPSDNPPASSNSAPPTDPTKIKVRVDLVNVLFTVTDKKNRLVIDLTKDDFNIVEDTKPQSIRYFSREANLPLRIGVLIDTSNSIRDRLRFEQEAAIDFLNSTVRPKKDLAYVVGFDVEPQLVSDYTDNMEKLSTAIRSLQAGGVTGLYDAIYFACKEKMLFFPPPEPYLRRVMIVVSDGQDNYSVHTRDEALAMAQRAEVTIFTISTNRSGQEGRGDRILKYFAQETGGRAFFPFAAHDLTENFQEISRELRSQYSLGYVSTNPARDGTVRTISILAREKGLRIRSKSGYLAPTQ